MPTDRLADRTLLRLALVAFAVLLNLIAPASASSDPAFDAWIKALWPDAQKLGVTRATFDLAFKGVEPDLALPDLVLPGRPSSQVKGQSEFTKPPQDYLDKSYLRKLAAEGRGLVTQYASTLSAVETRIGVDRNILIAIWGRETSFGREKDPYYAVRALATEAYLGRRKDEFRKEVLYALKMLEEKVVTPEQMRSSWAGAMGLTQFLPSEYYDSAIRLEGTGRPDIFNSVPDALASAANQLKQKGWITGLPWGFEVRKPASAPCIWEGPVNLRPVSEWASRGFVKAGNIPFSPAELKMKAYLLMPAGTYGPAFLATENFLVIKRYNPADLYALFVAHLADQIAGKGEFEKPWTTIPQLPATDIEEIQRRLSQQGYDIQKFDGKAGVLTRAIVGAYERAHQLEIDCWPSASVLKHLRGTALQ